MLIIQLGINWSDFRKLRMSISVTAFVPKQMLHHCSPPLIKPPPSALKKICFITRGVASLEGDNLVVFYYLGASEIWPDKRVAFGGRGLIRRGLLYIYSNEKNITIFIPEYIIFIPQSKKYIRYQRVNQELQFQGQTIQCLKIKDKRTNNDPHNTTQKIKD